MAVFNPPCENFSLWKLFPENRPLLTNWEIFWDLYEKTFENFSANPTTNQLGTFRANNKWVLKNFLSAPPTNQLGNFLRFWQSNMKKIPSIFQKALLLTLNWGSNFEGVFQISPQKYFSLHLLWIRGAICGVTFEKILKYFSIKAQKSRPPGDGRTAEFSFQHIEKAKRGKFPLGLGL